MAYGLVAGTYTVNLQDNLIREGIKVSRIWNSIDDLIAEVNENSSFVYELASIIILDDALTKTFLTHQKATKIFQLQKRFDEDKVDTRLKMITLNKDLFAQLKETIKVRQFGIYRYFELHFAVKRITVENLKSFYLEDYDSMVDNNPKDVRNRTLEDLRLTLKRIDTVTSQVEDFHLKMEEDLSRFKKDTDKEFVRLKQQLEDIQSKL